MVFLITGQTLGGEFADESFFARGFRSRNRKFVRLQLRAIKSRHSDDCRT